MGVLADLYTILQNLLRRREVKLAEARKAQILAALNRVVALSDATIAERLGVEVSAVIPLLDGLVQDGRLVRDTLTGFYSRAPMPWNQPRGLF